MVAIEAGWVKGVVGCLWYPQNVERWKLSLGMWLFELICRVIQALWQQAYLLGDEQIHLECHWGAGFFNSKQLLYPPLRKEPPVVPQWLQQYSTATSIRKDTLDLLQSPTERTTAGEFRISKPLSLGGVWSASHSTSAPPVRSYTINIAPRWSCIN